MRTGDRDESRNKGNATASDSSSSGQPVRTGKEVRQHSEIDLRVDGIPQEETNNIWTTSKSKWKSSKDESKSKGMHEDKQKKEIFQVKKQASTFFANRELGTS